MAVKVLITGPPRVGKTTLIQRLIEALPGAAGFYTGEIRERGVRKGFTLTALDGTEGVLSHVDFKSPHRVGKYKVDIPGFEAFLDRLTLREARVVVIDEIGKMECLSEKFRHLIRELLRSDKTLLATIALRGTPFIEGLKQTPGVRLVNLSEENREEVLQQISSLLTRR